MKLVNRKERKGRKIGFLASLEMIARGIAMPVKRKMGDV